MTYKIQIQPSGHIIEAEKDELILEAALRQGVSFPYGCRSGVCGTCLGKVLQGEIEYPDDLPMGISEQDHAEGRALFCQAVAKSDLVLEVAEIASVSEIEIKTLPAKVESLRKLAPDVMEVMLKLPETERMQFLAGQYIYFLLPDGRKRAFSLANAPYNDAYLELHIRHIPNGRFTEQLFGEMKEKSLVRIEGPHGTFFLRENERPKIFMGGGTGFAPIKGMIEQMIEEGISQPIYIYWGVRSAADLYHQRLAEKWAQQFEPIEFVPVLSEPQPEDNWTGRSGLVHEAIMADFSDLADYDIYMSGPPVMVNAGSAAFKTLGATDEHLFSDAFEYSADALAAMKA